MDFELYNRVKTEVAQPDFDVIDRWSFVKEVCLSNNRYIVDLLFKSRPFGMLGYLDDIVRIGHRCPVTMEALVAFYHDDILPIFVSFLRDPDTENHTDYSPFWYKIRLSDHPDPKIRVAAIATLRDKDKFFDIVDAIDVTQDDVYLVEKFARMHLGPPIDTCIEYDGNDVIDFVKKTMKYGNPLIYKWLLIGSFHWSKDYIYENHDVYWGLLSLNNYTLATVVIELILTDIRDFFITYKDIEYFINLKKYSVVCAYLDNEETKDIVKKYIKMLPNDQQSELRASGVY